MERSTPPRNLAHRMGRWSGRHPWMAILGWIAFVAVCVVAGSSVGTTKIDENTSGPGDAGRAARTLDQAGFNDRPATEIVFVQSRQGRLSNAALKAVAKDVEAGLGAVPEVTHVGAVQRSTDGRSAKIELELRGKAEDAPNHVAASLAAVAKVAAAHPTLRVDEFGEASAGKALDERLSKDFQQAEVLSIPITLIILIVAFGALLAAGIPVLLGLTSVFSAIGIVAITSAIIPTSDGAPILMMLMGMAVGVDYSLFYLKQEREERARGAAKLAALEAAAATSGHA